jgi:hypothetical protein
MQWMYIAAFFTTNLGLFLYWYVYLSRHGITVHTYYHKYPPDIYYFSFSIWTVILAYALIHFVARYMGQTGLVIRFLTYVSTHSYTVFFVHILVLYVLDVGFPRRPFPYLIFSILVLIPTFLILRAIDHYPTVINRLLGHK